MKRFNPTIVTWLLLTFILIAIVNIYTVVKDRDSLAEKMHRMDVAYQSHEVSGNDRDKKIAETIEIINEQNKRILAQSKEVQELKKKVDSIKAIKGKDGRKGSDGAKGVKGDKGEKGEDGDNGKDAPHIKIMCDTVNNRWMALYNPLSSWQIIYNEIGSPAKCNVKE